jgi:hypothetical protein
LHDLLGEFLSSKPAIFLQNLNNYLLNLTVTGIGFIPHFFFSNPLQLTPQLINSLNNNILYSIKLLLPQPFIKFFDFFFILLAGLFDIVNGLNYGLF